MPRTTPRSLTASPGCLPDPHRTALSGSECPAVGVVHARRECSGERSLRVRGRRRRAPGGVAVRGSSRSRPRLWWLRFAAARAARISTLLRPTRVRVEAGDVPRSRRDPRAKETPRVRWHVGGCWPAPQCPRHRLEAAFGKRARVCLRRDRGRGLSQGPLLGSSDSGASSSGHWQVRPTGASSDRSACGAPPSAGPRHTPRVRSRGGLFGSSCRDSPPALSC